MILDRKFSRKWRGLVSALARGSRFVDRLLNSYLAFGIIGTLQVHVIFRTKIPRDPLTVHLRRYGQRFFFRGAADRGVLAHFYERSYRIEDRGEIRTIIDAGAHIGDQTVRFLGLYPNATVYALEPHPDNFRLLSRNVQRNSRAVPMNVALWKEDAEVRLTPGISTLSNRVTEGEEGYRVKSVSMESLIGKFNLESIDLLKLDIEGSERAVFSGDTDDWLKRVRALIFEVPDVDAPGTTSLIFERIRRTGHQYDVRIDGECLILVRSDTRWTLQPVFG